MEVVSLQPDSPFESDEHHPVTVFHGEGQRVPLVFIRSWMDELVFYRTLARELGPDQPIYTVAPPTGARVEDFPQSVGEWADWILRRIDAIHGPVILGGFSFGGVLALELARVISAAPSASLSPRGLLFLDTSLPRRHVKTEKSWMRRLANHLNAMADQDMAERREYLKQRYARRQRRIARKASNLSASDAAGQTVVTSTGQKMPLLTRAIWVSYLKYRAPEITLPTAVFWTRESARRAGDSALGWAPHLQGSYCVDPVPGEHFTFMGEGNVGRLAGMLNARIAFLLGEASTDRG